MTWRMPTISGRELGERTLDSKGNRLDTRQRVYMGERVWIREGDIK